VGSGVGDLPDQISSPLLVLLGVLQQFVGDHEGVVLPLANRLLYLRVAFGQLAAILVLLYLLD
jgi:hypothetical protein